jgi:hypothetical protein
VNRFRVLSDLKLVVGAIMLGICAALASATIRCDTEIGLPEIGRFGYPLPWVITDLNGPTQYVAANLIVDVLAWVAVSLISIAFLSRIVFPNLGIAVNARSLLLGVILFIPLGLVVDLVHESGHALAGTAMGGRMTYMKIAFFEIYPQLTLTSQFQLGLARIEGLEFGTFGYGLMLLGGSLITNIASWTIGLVLLKTSMDNRVNVVLKGLGIFGILDLPLYVFLPQIGLKHWIFLGGECGQEPLIGTRMMGIPDSIVYLTVTVSTIGLVLLYSETMRKKLIERLASHRSARRERVKTVNSNSSVLL